MRNVLTALLVCAGMVLPLSCKKSESGKMVIAVIPKGTMHVFWKSVHAGAAKAGQELGVEIIWQGPTKEDEAESEIKVVENMVNRGVKGIVLAPLDDKALVRPVTEAKRKGIPTVIIDSDLAGKAGEDFVSFVATDNELGGYKAGKHLAKLLGEKGKVVLLRHNIGSASTHNREEGFLRAMGEHKDIQVVSSSQYGGVTTESAKSKSLSLLAPLRKEDGGGLTVDGVFCPNESTTSGMLLALQDMKVAGKVRFVGFDSADNLVTALRSGEIDGLILQDPVNMGYLGVKTMVQHLRGEKVEPRIDTGSTLVTKEIMDKPEIKELLTPDLSKWLKE